MENPLNILFIIDSLGKGGIERRMLELVKHISHNTNYKVTLVCLSPIIEYDYVYDLPINFISLTRRSKKDPVIFLKLFKLIRSTKPHIIHSWGSMSNIYTLPIAKLLHIKFITSVVADAPQNLTYRHKAFFRARLTFPFADRITSNSLAGLKAYKAPLKKSLCIYNGFDEKRLKNLPGKASIIQKLGIEDAIIIGMVGAFDGRKDFSTLIAAAVTVVKEVPEAVFLLIGEGYLRKDIMQEVPASLKDKIIFTGNISNAESYMNIFDIGVLCTNTKIHQEGISNSIMEYMALQKPVVATSGGGTNEIVVDGETGFLIPSHNPDQLAEKIIELVKKPDVRSRFGKAALKRIQDLFNIEGMCNRFYSLYKEVLINK